jgi:hypothetical protein
MRKQLLAALALPVFMAACASAPVLQPGPGAQPAPSGPGDGAIGESAGVRVVARSDAWDGIPTNLEQRITPVLVEITNNSTTPLLIRYRSFELQRVGGRTEHALPPFEIEGEVTQEIGTLHYPYSDFTIAPYLRRYYPRMRIADGFLLDDVFYNTYRPVFRTLNLPTGDMVQKALPEGVLAAGGKVTGFLYFPALEEKGPINFSMDLLNATTRVDFGDVQIPFVTR